MVTNLTKSTSLGIPGIGLVLQGDLSLFVEASDFVLELPWIGE